MAEETPTPRLAGAGLVAVTTALLTAGAALAGVWLGGLSAERVTRLEIQHREEAERRQVRRQVYRQSVAVFLRAAFDIAQAGEAEPGSEASLRRRLQNDYEATAELAGDLALTASKPAVQQGWIVLRDLLTALDELIEAPAKRWPRIAKRVQIDLTPYLDQAREELGSEPVDFFSPSPNSG